MEKEIKILHTCRICLEQSKFEELISPCKCKGTSKYIHKICFIKWFSQSFDYNCKICKSDYEKIQINLKKPNFISWIKNEPEWLIFFFINLVPMVHDFYLVYKHSEINYRNVFKEKKSFKPISITSNFSNLVLYFSLYNSNFSIKFLSINIPFELICMFLFLKKSFTRFRAFQYTNVTLAINFEE